jgi:aryl-alcohol dehydrogenase-like predicted oxidoreductase
MSTVVKNDLVFGCSTLSQQETLKESLRLLAQASELGIVHFDTARAYGEGESEVILGRHLRGRRDQMIVTTKWGLRPPVTNELMTRAYARASSRTGMSPAVEWLRAGRRALRPSIFSPGKIRTGLETSLRALGADYIDYFLLHEATADEACRGAVIRTLEQLVVEGKIRQFGLGSEFAKIGPREGFIPAPYRVLQFEHNPLAKAGLEVGERPGRRIFTHSSLSAMGRVAELLVRHSELVRSFSTELDTDVASPRVLPGLLLAYSHARNASGKVIFSTRSSRHLADNITTYTEVRDWPSDRLLALEQLFDRLSAEGRTEDLPTC